MASICGSSKSHPGLTTSSFYRPGAYPYQSEYYLPPRSAWSRVPPPKTNKANSKWKIGSAMLIISAMLVLVAVLAIAGLALWMGALRTDSKDAVIGFTCSFRIVRGERYNPMLKLNTSMVFREKERKYKNIFELLFRRSIIGASYKQTVIDKFENGTLKVFFRLYLDRRKIPRSITNVEDVIEDIIVKETYSTTSLFKTMELDLNSISIKRINPDAENSQKVGQQRNTMITKNGLLRTNRNNSLVTSSKPKMKPVKMEPNEAEIDFTNIPTIQGTYMATKINETVTKEPKIAETSRTTITSTSTVAITELPVIDTTVPYFSKTSEKLAVTKSNYRTSTVLGETTTEKIVDDLFKDFVNPDFETSPWRPIIPGYINTGSKLHPERTKPSSQLDSIISDVPIIESDSVKKDGKVSSSKIPDDTKKVDEKIEEKVTVKSTVTTNIPEFHDFAIALPDSGIVSVEDTDFPQDRIVPQEMVNFRVNSKFKNKIPEVEEQVTNFNRQETDNIKHNVDLEVAGQIPQETYNVHLSTISGFGKIDSSLLESKINDKKITSTFTTKTVPRFTERPEVQNFEIKQKNGTPEFPTIFSLPTLAITTPSATIKPIFPNYKESSSTVPPNLKISGVGIAEPILDTEIELEGRNRFSETEAIIESADGMQDRKVDQFQPIYTSYRTPDLNGAAKPSLLENPGTLKPFRHTIPFDKIASAIDNEDDNFEPAIVLQPFSNTNTTQKAIIDTEKSKRDNEKPKNDKDPKIEIPKTKITSSSDNLKEKLNLIQSNITEEFTTLESEKTENTKKIENLVNTSTPSYKKVQIELKYHEPITADSGESTESLIRNPETPLKSAKIELSEQHKPITNKHTAVIDDEKMLKLTTTELYSEILHPHQNNIEKLTATEPSIDSQPAKLTATSLRNLTFVEIDTVKHTPGEVKESVYELPEVNGTSSVSANETSKKIYNDTLKANVVQDLVTLAPAKSNTGVGRPVRPRPKPDELKNLRKNIKNNNTVHHQSSSMKNTDSVLLEQLFSLQNDRKDPVRRDSADQEKELLKEQIPVSDFEQIVEVVTSISTKISSNVNDKVLMKLVVSNTTSIPVINTVSHSNVNKFEFPAVNRGSEINHGFDEIDDLSREEGVTAVDKEEIIDSEVEEIVNTTKHIVWTEQKAPLISADLRKTTQTSDRKISNSERDQMLLEKLKEFAEVRTDDDIGMVNTKNKNGNNGIHFQNISDTQIRNQSTDSYQTLPNFEDLKKIADISTGNETALKNTTSNFTFSRDGVQIFTKVFNKADERVDKMISTTEENRLKNSQKCIGFQCNDGLCLPSGARCNMLRECQNSEDELNCSCADFLKAQLLNHKICDGIADCWDYSDETDCDWCQHGHFVCGNSRSCIEHSKVCDGFRDCPGGEDEKKCAALIEDNEQQSYEGYNPSLKKNNTDLLSKEMLNDEEIAVKEPNPNSDIDQIEVDQEAVESSILETTTFRIIVNDGTGDHVSAEISDQKTEADRSRPKELAAYTQMKTKNNPEMALVSGREISSGSKDNVVHENAYIAGTDLNIHSANRKEVNSYSDRGFLSVRKNGQWGKLCLGGMNNLLQERQAIWTIEDLGRAVCKAITYQDYERVEKVTEENPKPNRLYYSLSYSEKFTDKTSLTFKSSDCPSGEVLRVKCKNLECGIRTQVPTQARIVGGGSSSAGSWPWQVALYKEGDYQCGGALINDKWIVSAAHCFYHAQSEYWVARIGTTRRGSFPSPHEQLIKLDHIALHPDYVDNGFINDIALLRLEKSAAFGDYVRPICLPDAEPKSGTTCTVTGWGQLFEIGRIFPDTLQEVELPVISTEDCRRKTLFLPLYKITSGMLCAGLKDGGRDACLGDSGGPLVCAESDNKYTLQGITSNGYGCARPGRPGVYTKVHHYLPWIERIISKNDIQSSVSSCKGHRCPLGECLPKSRICNGFLECSDGSDESGCIGS
ncbi:uncharacterized protein LOC107270868 isoform X2 [Cephus cinctus]|uniref:Uncharacterized protein LOC107270868 isoform X2 n=1 Tax=Cephus cinctus TaxID=211228 RepID=A0AAJ7C4G0_CEPCN|nr:uncharacterized protein LOC107270868 isoform X2 [Cephus cinctus]